MRKFIVPSATNLKTFTDATYPQGSFYLNALLRAGDVRVNGRRVRSSVPLSEGDEVTYFTTPKMEAKPSHRVIYADQCLLAADKFSGVSTEALACELGLIPVHRLDRNTCGVLLFARDEVSARALEELFKKREIEKKYICICRDGFRRDGATLSAYLFKDEKMSEVTISDRPKAGYVPILTQYLVLGRMDGLARVEVTLHTGKTHQIRAHMAHIGCPVLGDEKYGDTSLNALYGLKRQLLCSYSLAFSFGGKNYAFESSLAPDFPEKKKG